MAKNIAMWSGPRNLSTAMMYSFSQRSDCNVWDEPFYAAYLKQTGLEHPMYRGILAAGDVDPKQVIAKCLEEADGVGRFNYQKQMTQHMIEGIDRSWILQLDNVFLIRHPARVLASYDIKRSNPTLDDIGFTQQMELVEFVQQETNQVPLIIDSADVRSDPEAMLTKLCDKLGLEFEPEMLSWSKGGISSDGVWAKHWYGAVWNSTGFAGAETQVPDVRAELQPVLNDALEVYAKLAALKVSL